MPTLRNSGAIDITSIKHNWRGEWASSGIYGKNDVVRYKGRTYYCKTDALFEQNLAGIEYGPGAQIYSPSDAMSAGSLAPTTWNLNPSTTLFTVGANSQDAGRVIRTNKPLFTTIKKAATATTAWDASAYSTEFYTTSAYISGSVPATGTTIMFGLNSDPKTSVSYIDIDYAWYFAAGTVQIYENGALIASYGSYTTSTVLSISYDGKNIYYWKDGVLQRTVARAIGAALYADSSINTAGASISLGFGPGEVNQYWDEHTEGYLYRGGWMPYRQYWPGDIVKCRGSVYMCRQANYNGHPLYKNGMLLASTDITSPDWDKLMSTSYTYNSEMVEVLPNMPPLGWTKYRASEWEPGHFRGDTRHRFFDTSGHVYASGQTDDEKSNGSGLGYGNAVGTVTGQPQQLSFDHWDYRFGRLPGHFGQAPKCIQLLGNDFWGLALFDNGEVYHWGYNGHGQSGDGTTNETSYPVRCGYVAGTHDYRSSGTAAGYLATTRIVKLASGSTYYVNGYHTVGALDSSGNVWCWGYNGYGQCGSGDKQNKNIPTIIDRKNFDGQSIVDLWAGKGNEYEFFYAIDAQGQLWSWGHNGRGALGNGNIRDEPRPQRVKYNFNLFGGIKKIQLSSKGSYQRAIVLCNDGSVHACGDTSGDAIAGGHELGYSQNFRPIYDVAVQNLRKLGDKADNHGSYINVLQNADDIFSTGGWSAEHGLLIKEKGTGLLYGMGSNVSNKFAISAAATMRENDSGGLTGERFYFPVPSAIPAPDLTILCRAQCDNTVTLYYITECGKVYAAGGNANGVAGFGYAGVTPPANMMISGQRNWGLILTTEANAVLGGVMRVPSRVGVIGGANGPGGTGTAFITTEEGSLMGIGLHTTYARFGKTARGATSIDPVDGVSSLGYNLSDLYSATKVLW